MPRASFNVDANRYPQQINANGLADGDLEAVHWKKGFPFELPKKLIHFGKKKAKKNVDKSGIDLAKDVKITEHLLSIDELCSKLQTNLETGLSESEAAFRLKRDGLNQFTPPKQTPKWILFIREMTGGFALLLWFAAIASCIAYAIEKVPQDYYLAIVLALVVIITGTFSYYQAASSASVFDSFKNMIPPQTYVIRDGHKKLIDANLIVLGDLVQCKSGDRVPADIRVIKSEGMKVDNSSLTGESDPLLRTTEAGHNAPLEAKNLAFFSTNCVDGSGSGIVIATGDNTVMGNIAKLVSNIKNEKTPIAIEINRFVKIITAIAVISGLLFFSIALGFGSTFFQAFLFMIGITVGNVPEGLLPALTAALTLTAKRMASKKCLVKHLEAVETLGSTSTICTDKTGTLTQNRMTVEHCWVGNIIHRVSHEKNEVDEQMRPIQKCWDAYSRCCILCSRAEFTDNNPDIMKRACSGDASETAILRFMESVIGPVIKYRAKYPKVAEKPFSSTYKYQYSIHKNSDINSNSKDGSISNFFLVMKGAPERIIKLCTTIVAPDGESIDIDDEVMKNFEETYRELGSMGERVIAFCDYEFTQFPPDYKFNLDEGNDFTLGGFRFLGLIALIDPPRPSVPDAVAKCRSAGIKVIMVTGDHPITAQAIAKMVGIFSHSHRRSTRISMLAIDNIVRGGAASIVVPGDELAELQDEELRDILKDYNEIVFARTSPQQKLRIVENCQYLGQIVAVTGDGVNDSPALKKANIGIAMGITGSDVSKQAADMILLDDNFATIVIGVEEGRRIFDNMKKTVAYIMAGNVTTLYPFIFYVIFGFPLAIGTITVLLICLGTDMVPAISLAYEKAESDIMKLKPRNPFTDKLVTRNLLLRAYFQIGVIETVAGYLGYFVIMMHYGWKPQRLWELRVEWDSSDDVVDSFGNEWTSDERQVMLIRAQSAYFIAVVVTQWMDVIVCKTRRRSNFRHGMGNWFLNFSILFETALACFFCYTPGLHTVFSTGPVIGWVWLCAVPFFFYILLYEELRKYIIRNYPNSFLASELLV